MHISLPGDCALDAEGTNGLASTFVERLLKPPSLRGLDPEFCLAAGTNGWEFTAFCKTWLLFEGLVSSGIEHRFLFSPIQRL